MKAASAWALLTLLQQHSPLQHGWFHQSSRPRPRPRPRQQMGGWSWSGPCSCTRMQCSHVTHRASESRPHHEQCCLPGHGVTDATSGQQRVKQEDSHPTCNLHNKTMHMWPCSVWHGLQGYESSLHTAVTMPALACVRLTTSTL